MMRYTHSVGVCLFSQNVDCYTTDPYWRRRVKTTVHSGWRHSSEGDSMALTLLLDLLFYALPSAMHLSGDAHISHRHHTELSVCQTDGHETMNMGSNSMNILNWCLTPQSYTCTLTHTQTPMVCFLTHTHSTCQWSVSPRDDGLTVHQHDTPAHQPCNCGQLPVL